MSDEQFFRQADEQEKSYIAESEQYLYQRQHKSFVLLLLIFTGAFIVGLVRGAKGLLVIINDEKNILLTCKYRFFFSGVK